MAYFEISRLHSNLQDGRPADYLQCLHENLFYFGGELKKNTQDLSRHEAWIIKICTPDCVITPQNWKKSLLK